MTPEEFLRSEYPITAMDLDNKKTFGFNDIAFIMDKYAAHRLKDFGEGISRMIQYNTGNTVAQIKETIKHFSENGTDNRN